MVWERTQQSVCNSNARHAHLRREHMGLTTYSIGHLARLRIVVAEFDFNLLSHVAQLCFVQPCI